MDIDIISYIIVMIEIETQICRAFTVVCLHLVVSVSRGWVHVVHIYTLKSDGYSSILEKTETNYTKLVWSTELNPPVRST